MNKEYLVGLAKNLYKITLLFPRKEPLRYKMREIADAILEDFIGLSCSQNFKSSGADLLSSLEVLDGFFEVAKDQNWVKESDILAIQQEYDKLRFRIQQNDFEETFGKSDQQLRLPDSADSAELNHLTGFVPEIATNVKKEKNIEKVNPRQKTILDFLKENGRVQVWQVKEILPDISKRTLRRDFEYMLKKGIIERIGQRNSTFYQIRAFNLG